jgi:hypothetical protein
VKPACRKIIPHWERYRNFFFALLDGAIRSLHINEVISCCENYWGANGFQFFRSLFHASLKREIEK